MLHCIAGMAIQTVESTIHDDASGVFWFLCIVMRDRGQMVPFAATVCLGPLMGVKQDNSISHPLLFCMPCNVSGWSGQKSLQVVGNQVL